MKKYVVLITFALLSTAMAANQGKLLDRIVAVVSNRVITQSQLDSNIRQVKANLSRTGVKAPPEAALKEQVLQHMITQNLQLQLAKRNQLTVTSSEVTAAIKRMAKQNKLTLKTLHQQVEQHGGNFTEFKHNIRDQLIVEKLQQMEVGPKVNITPQDIKTMKKALAAKSTQAEYHLLNILIPLPAIPSTQQVQAAEKQAETIVMQLKNGGNFKSIALANSSDQNALKGGDLGWRPLAALPDVFANSVHTLKTGQLAGPFRATNGFHILKVAGIRHQSNDKPASDAEIKNLLYRKKFLEQLQTWLQGLQGNAYIKVIN